MESCGRVLDFGAGTGNVSSELVKRNIDVVALEVNGEMAKHIEEKTEKQKIDIKIISPDEIKLPYNDQEFEGVTAMNVLSSRNIYLSDSEINRELTSDLDINDSLGEIQFVGNCTFRTIYLNTQPGY